MTTPRSHLGCRPLPPNYDLTFSWSGENASEYLAVLAKGHNVAVAFAGDKPVQWRGFDVIDGEAHDLR